jgi:hypothetical protein
MRRITDNLQELLILDCLFVIKSTTPSFKMASTVDSKLPGSGINGVVRANPTVVDAKPGPTVTKRVNYKDFLELRDMYGKLRYMLEEGADIKYKTVHALVKEISKRFDEMEKLMENDQPPNNGDVLGELREMRDILDSLEHDREHQSSMYHMVQKIDKRIYESEKLMKDLQATVPYFDEIIENTNNSVLAIADILKGRDAMVKDDVDFLMKEYLDAKVRMTTRMLERETKWRSIVDDLILLALPRKSSAGREEESDDRDVAKPAANMERKRKRSTKTNEEELESKTYEFGKWPRWG